jgi:hypothetical protein
MKTFHFLLAVLGLASCGALRADDTKPAPRVDVVYVNPEKFTNVTDDYFFPDEGRDEYLRTLKQHIEAHADKYIPAGQHLALRITDVKMAGDFEPQRGPGFESIRIYKDVYPPRINLEFNPYFEDDTSRYEKKLLDDWFYHEFGEAKG